MIIVDEFHNLGAFGSDRYSIDSLFAEARQFEVGFVTATQSLSKLRREVARELLVNTRTLICLNSSYNEAKLVESELGVFNAGNIPNLEVGQGIARVERPIDTFDYSFSRMKIPDSAISKQVITKSDGKPPIDRAEVERMVQNRFQSESREDERDLRDEEHRFLEYIAGNPDQPVTRVYRVLGFGTFKGNRVRELLKDAGYLAEIETRLGKRHDFGQVSRADI